MTQRPMLAFLCAELFEDLALDGTTRCQAGPYLVYVDNEDRLIITRGPHHDSCAVGAAP